MMYTIASTLIWAAEESEDEGGLALLLPETSELIAGVIAFAIIFFVIWKWALPSLNETIEARQAAIAASLKEAEDAKIEAQQLLDDYKAQLAGAQDEANRIIEEARATGDAARQDLVAKAEAEAAAVKAKAHEDIVQEQQRAAAAVRQQVADLSLDVAEKVVGVSLDRQAQEALVEQFIDQLGGVSN